jgi:HD-GYP domain-containing protein (c-di-GMP phosphodiesterase class II)
MALLAAAMPPLVTVLTSDPRHLSMARSVLENRYRLTYYDDSVTGLDFMYELHPAIIIVDAGVGPKGGLQAMREFRTLEELKRVPVLFCGLDDTWETIEDAFKHGANAFLKKPVRPDELLSETSALLCQSVEELWKLLPETPRKALENTLSSYKYLTECIINGHAIPFDTIRSSCEPLVEAIEEGHYDNLLSGVRDHDAYTYVHSFRVATLLALFGQFLGMKGNELVTLAVGGLLHDVGKINVRESLLNKIGALAGNERAVLESHVVETIRTLETMNDVPVAVRLIAAQHHEKLDGSGYPMGLEAKDLSQLSRMAAIADIFGALTDRRPYKLAMNSEEAFDTLESMSAGLDQDLVKIFKNMMAGL